MSHDDRARALEDGLTYEAFLEQWREKAARPVARGTAAADRKLQHYTRYNLERTDAVHAAYEPTQALRAELAQIDAPQVWMVITEDWCGDSAFNLPVVAAAAGETKQVTLRILPRDSHLDVMDRYLTNGTSRSVPKLVAFAEDGTELFQWGPRPAEAVALRGRWLEEGFEKAEVVKKLVQWYEDGGWRQVDAELAVLLR